VILLHTQMRAYIVWYANLIQMGKIQQIVANAVIIHQTFSGMIPDNWLTVRIFINILAQLLTTITFGNQQPWTTTIPALLNQHHWSCILQHADILFILCSCICVSLYHPHLQKVKVDKTINWHFSSISCWPKCILPSEVVCSAQNGMLLMSWGWVIWPTKER